MRRDITLAAELPYARTVVWRALTDPAALSEWLMEVHDFAAVPGTKFELRAKPMPGWDGVVRCTVLEVDEPARLVYSWQGSRMRAPTTVTWTLTAVDADTTRVRLYHQGFEGFGGALLTFMHRGGWRKFLRRKLRDYLGRHQANSAGPA